jgi:adenosylcobinamide-phosphate synthase
MEFFMSFMIIDILIAFLLDLLIGDPKKIPHPVCFIGSFINKTENLLFALIERKNISDENKKNITKKIYGVFLTLIICIGTFLIVFYIIFLCLKVSIVLYHIMNIYFIYSSLAMKCLAHESKKVGIELFKNDINSAKKQLSMLVSRDTKNLNKEDIIKGVVETTAENTVDGVISPLFYIFLGSFFGISAPLVYLFKASSTLDSMVGYNNEKYKNFGFASAKLDDLLNYIPARITGVLIVVSSFGLGFNYKNSYKILRRDRHNHKSPNCPYPESAVAGALEIELGGNNIYFGKVVNKPCIGDKNKKIEIKDINSSIWIMYSTSFLALVIFLLISTMLNILIK